VRLGIVPGVISPYIVRKVGLAAAQKFMLTGSRFTADQCTGCGLVARTVPDSAQFEEALEATVTTFLQAGPDAARRTKELMRRISPLPTPDVFEFTASHIAAARCSDEGREGLASFFEKKQPSWQQGLPKERT
jgi:methylglutaconyl-CoA hydratase